MVPLLLCASYVCIASALEWRFTRTDLNLNYYFTHANVCVCLCECASACDIALLNIRPIFYQNDGGKWILFLLITIVPRHGHFAVFMPNATHISHGIYFSMNMFFFSETSSRYFTYSNMLIDMYFSIPFEISIYDCAQITMNFSSPGKRTLIIPFHLELHLLPIEIPTKAIEWNKTNLWFNSREKCFHLLRIWMLYLSCKGTHAPTNISNVWKYHMPKLHKQYSASLHKMIQ